MKSIEESKIMVDSPRELPLVFHFIRELADEHAVASKRHFLPASVGQRQHGLHRPGGDVDGDKQSALLQQHRDAWESKRRLLRTFNDLHPGLDGGIARDKLRRERGHFARDARYRGKALGCVLTALADFGIICAVNNKKTKQLCKICLKLGLSHCPKLHFRWRFSMIFSRNTRIQALRLT